MFQEAPTIETFVSLAGKFIFMREKIYFHAYGTKIPCKGKMRNVPLSQSIKVGFPTKRSRPTGRFAGMGRDRTYMRK
ncbi:hypothetical protein B5F96_02225 [Parabacteroides johnsonii]|uniref:Uncharacterized protein n=2 Tax=Parabacteroides johnsonii TaxID=387661 RepID=A0A9Q5SV92_9BACT|nr:hypothetical protein B5F96_02225 [Parabacteroides johnsonii]